MPAGMSKKPKTAEFQLASVASYSSEERHQSRRELRPAEDRGHDPQGVEGSRQLWIRVATGVEMTDIVERLRHLAMLKSLSGHAEHARMAMNLAAAEIERLTAAIHSARDVALSDPTHCLEILDAVVEQHAKIDAAVDDMVEKYPKTLDHLRRS